MAEFTRAPLTFRDLGTLTIQDVKLIAGCLYRGCELSVDEDWVIRHDVRALAPHRAQGEPPPIRKTYYIRHLRLDQPDARAAFVKLTSRLNMEHNDCDRPRARSTGPRRRRYDEDERP